MTADGLRAALVVSLEAAREREGGLWMGLLDVPVPEDGRWRLQDHVAHLAAWRRRAADLLVAARGGGEAPVWLSDIDAQNERIYSANRDLSADEVHREAERSYGDLIQTIEAGSEDDLHRPRPGHPEHEAWSAVPGNGHQHVAEHLTFLADERGDLEAADEAQVWAHDLVFDVFGDPVSCSHADYNLGCHYARRGRAAEALPLLRAALGANPELRPWAAQDKDLDPIRDRPEVAKLLST